MTENTNTNIVDVIEFYKQKKFSHGGFIFVENTQGWDIRDEQENKIVSMFEIGPFGFKVIRVSDEKSFNAYNMKELTDILTYKNELNLSHMVETTSSLKHLKRYPISEFNNVMKNVEPLEIIKGLKSFNENAGGFVLFPNGKYKTMSLFDYEMYLEGFTDEIIEEYKKTYDVKYFVYNCEEWTTSEKGYQTINELLPTLANNKKLKVIEL